MSENSMLEGFAIKLKDGLWDKLKSQMTDEEFDDFEDSVYGVGKVLNVPQLMRDDGKELIAVLIKDSIDTFYNDKNGKCTTNEFLSAQNKLISFVEENGYELEDVTNDKYFKYFFMVWYNGVDMPSIF